MNILAFSNCPLDPMLGSGKTRLAWSGGLAARGHHVRIVDSLELFGATSRGHEGPAGGHRWRLARLARRWLAELPASAWREVDLVEFYGAEFWLATWWLSRRPRHARPLLVAHTDGLEPLAAARLRASGTAPAETRSRWRTMTSQGCDRLAFARADGLVVGCEADRRFALEHGLVREPGCAVTVAPGLDEEFLRAAGRGGGAPYGPERRSGEERVAFLGSWIPRKGVRWLVAALDGLLHARPALRLSLGGLGRHVCPAEVLAAFAPGSRERVEVLPPDAPTADCREMLARAQVFLFPSEYEGFGLALAEAMACGCAVVTTPTGLGADLRDGEEALVCPFGDAAGMQAAVTRLLDDPDLRARLAAAGQARVRTMRWGRSVQRLEEVYQRWLERDR